MTVCCVRPQLHCLLPPHSSPLLPLHAPAADMLEAIAGDAPSATLPREQLVGALLCDVMVAVGMQPSKAAVRRMIKVGGRVGGRLGACLCCCCSCCCCPLLLAAACCCRACQLAPRPRRSPPND